ncbi:MAG: hypothetical protein ACREMV_15635, partial [Gemmatimonadales bacterium]
MPSRTVTAVLAVALLAPALEGQSIVLPNYERVRIGQREALEAGAFVARTSDAVAGWYNPAGLALSPKSGLNASASAEEWVRFQFGGANAEVARARIQSLGTFVGGVLGPPVIKSDRWRLGFSFSRPVSWRPSAVNTAFSGTVPGGTELVDYASEVEFSTWVPALAAGYKATEAVRLGLRVAGAVTHLSEDESLADRVTAGGTAAFSQRLRAGDGNVYHVLLSGGVQWDVSRTVSVGAHVTAPGIRIGGKSLVAIQRSAFADTGSTDLNFRDPATTFDYKLPMRAAGGLALRFGQGEVEVDVIYVGAADAYDVYATTDSAVVTVVDSTGAATVTTTTVGPVRYSARDVVNVAVGGHYRLSRVVKLHGGVFTDRSPVDDQTSSPFTGIDLVGATRGVSLGAGRLTGSVGLVLSAGCSDEITLGPLLSGQT